MPTPPTINTPASNGPNGGFLGMLHPQQSQGMIPATVGSATPYANVQDLSTAPSALPRFLSDATHDILVRAGNTAHLELYNNFVTVAAENKALK